MLGDEASIEAPASPRRNEIGWLKSLFDKHDPRRQTPDVTHSIRLDETELNRLLNYAVELRRVRGVAAELEPERALIAASLVAPENPFGRYLNVEIELAATPSGVDVTALKLGALPVPGALADWLAKFAHRKLREDATYSALADAFVAVHFNEGEATLDYRWEPELLTRVERKSFELLVPEVDRQLMLMQAERLDALLQPHPTGSSVALVTLLPAFFREPPMGELQAEHRAALAAFAAYLSGISLPHLLAGDDTASFRRAPRINLVLHGRRDFAEHYLISAALAANAGARLARALGLYKEEDDAGRGSGFSFTDLGADRAGVRLGVLAVGSDAVRVREQLASARHDRDLMPDFRGLPEFMPQAEFERRFGPVGSARYQRIIEGIDARIAAHPLLQ